MAKEMRLVSEEEYQRLLKQGSTNSVKSQKNTNNGLEGFSLLDDVNVPDDIKVHLYSSLLRKILFELQSEDALKQKIDDKASSGKLKVSDKEVQTSTPQVRDVAVTATTFNLLTDRDLSFIGKDFADTARSHAKLVLSIFKNNPALMKWNLNGEVSFFNNKFEPATNLNDLLSYAFRHVQMPIPPGFNRFMKACSYIEFPSAMLVPRAKVVYDKFMKDPEKTIQCSPNTVSDSALGRFEPLRSCDKI